MAKFNIIKEYLKKVEYTFPNDPDFFSPIKKTPQNFPSTSIHDAQPRPTASTT